MAFDLEDFRDALVLVLQNGMAAKVAEINLEKGDDPVLVEIPAADYFLDFNSRIVNVPQFIHFGFMPFEPSIPNGSEVALPSTMFFSTFTPDQEGGIVGENKILRYTRAMLEIFASASTQIANISELELTPFPPMRVNLDHTSEWYKVGGVHVKGIVVL